MHRSPDPDLAIGIDVGGTHVRVALYRGLRQMRDMRAQAGCGGPAPEPLARRRELVGERRDPHALSHRLAELVAELTAPLGSAGAQVPVGIGVAALFSNRTGHVSISPHLLWRDVPFGAIAREVLQRPVAIYNDATAAAYGEHALGAGVGAADMLAVFVGTGIGAGLVVGGRLCDGATGCAGELGHFRVAYGDDAPPCQCGMRGCVEAFIGGHYIRTRAHRELAAGATSAALALAGGKLADVHPGHLDEAAAQGDRYALGVYADIAPMFAFALGHAISLLNPARLVLGGGMFIKMPVLRAHVIKALETAASRAVLDPLTIRDCALGDDAGLLGSALLATEAA